MSNYWRADEDLNEDERFLRDYVMNRQWLETDSLSPGMKDFDGFWKYDGVNQCVSFDILDSFPVNALF